MPTETFHRLSSEKQQIILAESLNEFSTCSFADASLNQIIKKAGISRGSFYLYFDDKFDLYQYLVNYYYKQPFIDLLDGEPKQAKWLDYLYHWLAHWYEQCLKQPAFSKQLFQNAPYQVVEWLWSIIDEACLLRFNQPTIKATLRFHSANEQQLTARFYRMMFWEQLEALVYERVSLAEAKASISKQAVMLKIGLQK